MIWGLGRCLLARGAVSLRQLLVWGLRVRAAYTQRLEGPAVSSGVVFSGKDFPSSDFLRSLPLDQMSTPQGDLMPPRSRTPPHDVHHAGKVERIYIDRFHPLMMCGALVNPRARRRAVQSSG